jgi:hypothetical protein
VKRHGSIHIYAGYAAELCECLKVFYGHLRGPNVAGSCIYFYTQWLQGICAEAIGYF